MRRIRFGRCTRGGDNAGWVDRSALHRADDELDALGLRESRESMPDDYTARLLAALAADVDDDAPPRRKLPQPRRMLSRAALATGLTAVALSGTGIAAAAVTGHVAPLQPIQTAVQALYDRDGESTAEQVRALMEQASADLAAGRLGAAQQALEEAGHLLAGMHGPEAEALAVEISDLRFQLAQARREGEPRGATISPSPSSSHRPSSGDEASSPRDSVAAPVTGTPSANPTHDGRIGVPGGDTGGGDSGDPPPATPTPDSPSPSPSRSGPGSPGDSDESGDGGTGDGGTGDVPGEDGGSPGGEAPDGGGTSDDSTVPDGGGKPAPDPDSTAPVSGPDDSTDDSPNRDTGDSSEPSSSPE